VDIASWLRGLGLERYEAAFLGNDIGPEILRHLTADDLKELGVATVGHRRQLLVAIGELQREEAPKFAKSTDGHLGLPSAGERRQLTVMFCDLVGSTALSEKLDPEELRSLLHAYRTLCGDVIARYDGFVARYIGDGILTYFGWPTAHEEDAERAVRAALEIVHTVRRASSTEDLSVHIGIATGFVVVGEPAGAGEGSTLAVGSTPNLAARLQGLAAADQIVIAASTHRLVGNAFALTDLGEHDLKGIAEPVHAWRVERALLTESRFDARRDDGALTPLVGREEEVDLLLRRWTQAKDGEGQMVLLSGEPGIGKSRILSTLRQRLDAQGVQALRFQCSPFSVNSAYWPMIDHLERKLAFGRDETADSKLDKLEALVVTEYGCRSADVRFVASILSLPCDARYSALPMTPQKHKDETLRTLVDLIDATARQQPSVMLFEDAHWADPTTLEVLDLLVDRVKAIPLLVVLTHRPEFQPRWFEQGHVGALNLSRLTRAQSAAMVAALANGKALPEVLLEQILTRTDGVPLFVEELTKSVLESGELREADDHYEYGGSARTVTIPATLRDSLMARLDRFMPVREVAQIGAAIGREFSYELIAAVAPMPQAQLEDSLARLSESGLAFRRGTPPDAVYTFKHALVQDAAYDSLLKSRRQELHGKIARVIEAQFPTISTTEPEVLAHHFGEAGEAEKAAHHWLEAGRRALRRSANTEAITHLTKGLGALTGVPKSEEALRSELEMQLSLGPVLSATRGWSALEAERVYRRAEVLAQELGADRERFDAVWGLWMIHNTGNAPEVARGITGELFQIAERLNDPALRMEAHHAAWACAQTLGDNAATIEHMRHGLAIYESEKHGGHAFSYGGHDTAVCGKAIGGVSLWVLGYPDQALHSTDAAIALAESMGHAPSLAHALLFASSCHKYCRDFFAVLNITDRLITLASEHRLTLYHAMGGVAQGWALAHQGELDKGLGELQRNLEGYDSEKPKAFSMSSRIALAEIYLKAGEFAQALHAINSALLAGQRSGARAWLAAALHIKGEVLASMVPARWPDAETCFKEALQVARTQQAKSLELRAATGLARLSCIEGRREDARNLLAPVYNWFTEGFDTADLKDAKALLDELT
jgi:class 3 adenylate cyclase/predicted ATPase